MDRSVGSAQALLASAIGRLHRTDARGFLYYAAPLVALLLGFLTVSILLLLIRVSPFTAYSALITGAVGSQYAIGLTLVRSVPLIFVGLSVAVAFRAGLFNIGAEGQLQMGGLATTYVALDTGNLPLAIMAGFAAGAGWGAIPGYLRARLQITEVISTIMLNFIAITTVVLIASGPLEDPQATYPTTPLTPASTNLPNILAGTPLHAGIFLALICAVITQFTLYRTSLGFRIRAVGLNAKAAQHAGMSVTRTIVVALALSGGLAGLTGSVEILGVQHQLGEGWSSGWGYTGIAVAFLARSSPLAVVPAALLYGFLSAGSSNMQISTGTPGALTSVLEGLPILYLLALTARPPRSRTVVIDETVSQSVEAPAPEPAEAQPT